MIYHLTIISNSKSKSARDTCNYYIEQIKSGIMSIDTLRELIRNCEDRIVANRMAIRLGRLIRNNKI